MNQSTLARLSERSPVGLSGIGQRLRQEIPPLAWLLLALWVGLMVPMPHILRLTSEETFLLALNVSVLLQAAAVMVILAHGWGWRASLIALGIVAALSWGMEALGSATGFPFGSYDYTHRLQPQLFHVPLLIPLAWWMMMGPAWAVAQSLGQFREGIWRFALLSGLAVTAWDLFLDPQMVAWGLWVWEHPRDLPWGYFGIPWVNYAGWILTGTLITLAVRPRPVPVTGLLFIYLVTWFLESVGLGFFFNMPGPALVGGVVMGGFLALGIWGLLRQMRRDAQT